MKSNKSISFTLKPPILEWYFHFSIFVVSKTTNTEIDFFLFFIYSLDSIVTVILTLFGFKKILFILTKFFSFIGNCYNMRIIYNNHEFINIVFPMAWVNIKEHFMLNHVATISQAFFNIFPYYLLNAVFWVYRINDTKYSSWMNFSISLNSLISSRHYSIKYFLYPLLQILL